MLLVTLLRQIPLQQDANIFDECSSSRDESHSGRRFIDTTFDIWRWQPLYIFSLRISTCSCFCYFKEDDFYAQAKSSFSGVVPRFRFALHYWWFYFMPSRMGRISKFSLCHVSDKRFLPKFFLGTTYYPFHVANNEFLLDSTTWNHQKDSSQKLQARIASLVVKVIEFPFSHMTAGLIITGSETRLQYLDRR